MSEDRRVRKTKTAIKQAFIQLLKFKELDKITINDITQLADINRGTFYLHYEDKYILLSDMEDEYTLALSKKINFEDIMSQNLNTETFAKIFLDKILKNIIYYLDENIDFYKVILTLNRKSQIEEKITSLIYENIKRTLGEKDEIEGIPLDYFHSYVSGAAISFIKHWVKDERRLPPDVVGNYLFKIIFNGPLRILINEHYH